MTTHIFYSVFGSIWQARLTEINHGKELLQIILHGCTGQQNAALTRKRKQSPGGLILPVLESMGLITNCNVCDGDNTDGIDR